jgi:hypothetical protein
VHYFAAARRDDHSSRPRLATRLQQPTRGFSSRPACANRNGARSFAETQTQRAGPALPSYLVLHHAGFAMPAPLLTLRWALTPPFHPYLRANHEDIPKVFLRAITGCRTAGGIFSVALSVNRRDARPPRRTAAATAPLALPGALPTPLSRFRCPDFPPAQPTCANRASDHPAHPPHPLYSYASWIKRQMRDRVLAN